MINIEFLRDILLKQNWIEGVPYKAFTKTIDKSPWNIIYVGTPFTSEGESREVESASPKWGYFVARKTIIHKTGITYSRTRKEVMSEGQFINLIVNLNKYNERTTQTNIDKTKTN
jgi:hypothetical protein